MEVVDGRVMRGARNREAIAEALLACYEDGILTPSAAQVAERAGVSARSVHNHFADMEALREEAAKRQWANHSARISLPDPNWPLAQRIEHMCTQRGELFDAIAPVRRAVLLAVHDSPAIAMNLARIERRMRRVIEITFANELAARGEPEDVVHALDALLSFDGWQRLRAGQGCSTARATRILIKTVTTLLQEEERPNERYPSQQGSNHRTHQRAR